jgi:DNA-binding transcriptional regulator GbsR (MarR family)
MSDAAPGERDPESISHFVERFAAALTDGGIPRMPARVFVALLAKDSGARTAAELSALLQISPAAVSGAVRYLQQVGLISREREPGSRRDHYRVHDDTWYEATVRRDQMLRRWAESVREGVEVLGLETRAGARMAETLAFFEFLEAETPALLDRWHEIRAGLGGPEAAASSTPH